MPDKIDDDAMLADDDTITLGSTVSTDIMERRVVASASHRGECQRQSSGSTIKVTGRFADLALMFRLQVSHLTRRPMKPQQRIQHLLQLLHQKTHWKVFQRGSKTSFLSTMQKSTLRSMPWIWISTRMKKDIQQPSHSRRLPCPCSACERLSRKGDQENPGVSSSHRDERTRRTASP